MEKILIVDDSVLQATRLKNILDEYEVIMEHSAEGGLRRASAEDFSLILLDVVMPDMDGFTLLKRLKEEFITKDIPVIMITSLSEAVHEQRGLVLGAVDYITKPFIPMIVKARVNTHVRLYQYRKQIEQESRIDQLTGVANRRQYDYYSAAKWKEAVRLHIPFSVCMFDIDQFKIYNDTFGHPAGDKVLATVAKAAASLLRRETDFFARYGGEEFVALLAGEASDQAFSHVTQIRQAIEDLHIPHKPSAAEWVTVSIGGITLLPENGVPNEFALKVADAMLYESKKNGRNRVTWANEQLKQLREK